MHHNQTPAPTPDALAGFAASKPAHRLGGGTSVAWRAGDIVLKQSPGPAEARCLAETNAGLPDIAACRFQRPVPAPGHDGEWEIDGWVAWRWIKGETLPARARDIVLAARAYHALIAQLPWEVALVSRDDPWARADRVAFGEARAEYPAEYQTMLAPFLAEPLPDLPIQRVHGDLTGNVVFAPGLSPGIIDLTLYWRPAAFAEAVVLIDQSWFASEPDPTACADTPALTAMLRRAAARRIAEQPEQVAAFGKDATEALSVAQRIANWTHAALDRLGEV